MATINSKIVCPDSVVEKTEFIKLDENEQIVCLTFKDGTEIHYHVKIDRPDLEKGVYEIDFPDQFNLIETYEEDKNIVNEELKPIDLSQFKPSGISLHDVLDNGLTIVKEGEPEINNKKVDNKIITKEDFNNLTKYTEYLREKIEDIFNYVEYLGETLDKSISYSEYLRDELNILREDGKKSLTGGIEYYGDKKSLTINEWKEKNNK
jgi:hypothetical protein